jgi:hypothetical protein
LVASEQQVRVFFVPAWGSSLEVWNFALPLGLTARSYASQRPRAQLENVQSRATSSKRGNRVLGTLEQVRLPRTAVEQYPVVHFGAMRCWTRSQPWSGTCNRSCFFVRSVSRPLLPNSRASCRHSPNRRDICQPRCLTVRPRLAGYSRLISTSPYANTWRTPDELHIAVTSRTQLKYAGC